MSNKMMSFQHFCNWAEFGSSEFHPIEFDIGFRGKNGFKTWYLMPFIPKLLDSGLIRMNENESMESFLFRVKEHIERRIEESLYCACGAELKGHSFDGVICNDCR